MAVDRALLIALGVKSAECDVYLPTLRELLPRYEIDTPLRIAHFLAQVLHESTFMRRTVENMNYSAAGLRDTFRAHFTAAEAARYARKPAQIGNRAYANRLGNGDEASGDGYRYRGRGLIQLTGKDNYRAFSRWCGEDVVAAPDAVANRYAVHCAVYFWTTKALNALADIDDVTAVTRAVNGGLNGLAERMQILDHARQALAATDLAPALPAPTHRVTASMLNIRSRPVVSPTTRVATLPQGTALVKIAESDTAGWIKVRAELQGRVIEGFVALDHIGALPATDAPVARAPVRRIEIPPVHLSKNDTRVKRVRDGGRAHPLGEPGRPRRTATTPAGKAAQLLGLIDYLAVEKLAHLRYKPAAGTTYCNIYAYDYCYDAQAYLPRVWWNGPALRQIGDGVAVPVEYDRTVQELNANALSDWLRDYGSAFGWQAVNDLDTLQAAANNGEVCVVVGKRTDANRPGHITVVAPESARCAARRAPDGSIIQPVESQAGRSNFRLGADGSRWWRRAEFQSFGFWRHA